MMQGTEAGHEEHSRSLYRHCVLVRVQRVPFNCQERLTSGTWRRVKWYSTALHEFCFYMTCDSSGHVD